MANWLTRVLPPTKTGSRSPGRQVSVSGKSPPLVARTFSKERNEKLPNATVVYGVAASALFVIALCYLVKGHWITGLFVMFPAACFLGFALYFLKHADD